MPTSTAIYLYNVGGNRGPRHPAHLQLEMVISPVPGALRSTHWASYVGYSLAALDGPVCDISAHQTHTQRASTTLKQLDIG